MRKILFTLVALFGMIGAANAQIATENSKLFDNVYVGAGGVVTTPLDFNSVFPLNAGTGLKIGKDITPVIGFEVESGVLFNDNNFGRWTSTAVKLTNVGLNGKVNLNNLLAGYKGAPRFFEVSTNTGLGWMHYWNTSANTLTAKTGVDFAFNLGQQKAWSIVVSPAIYWNLHNNGHIQFNKQNAQLALAATVVYHFKTSNGTRHFKTYDVGAMMSEISYLNDELAKKPKEVEVIKYVEKPVPAQPVATAAVAAKDVTPTYVFFAKNSSILTEQAKETLKSINAVAVSIKAYASPEGDAAYNKRLSERRAAAVQDFLTNNTTVKVTSAEGCGVSGAESARVAIIIAE